MDQKTSLVQPKLICMNLYNINYLNILNELIKKNTKKQKSSHLHRVLSISTMIQVSVKLL